MITKPPQNEYEKQIYTICSNIPKLPEGEKAIIYDFATKYIPDKCIIDFEEINLEKYIHNIIIIYNKHKNSPVIDLVNTFINKFHLEIRENKKLYLEGTGSLDCKKIVI